MEASGSLLSCYSVCGCSFILIHSKYDRECYSNTPYVPSPSQLDRYRILFLGSLDCQNSGKAGRSYVGFMIFGIFLPVIASIVVLILKPEKVN